MLPQKIHLSASSADIQGAHVLAYAGRVAYQKALGERLPLAHIAEQSERSQYWFANNILLVVDVYATPPGEANHIVLTRELVSGLKLTDDMSALIDPDDNQPKYVDLRVTKEQFERYMKWARTVY
ncbi:MAG: hypothetical protein KGM97_03885 [Alphaproteobacteria bacterium]|nr:hypothetical protein [Alphaproteobacteria bacterium]MDE2630112.1 hypothetical protein [Alphaproteobacteria bacterium]